MSTGRVTHADSRMEDIRFETFNTRNCECCESDYDGFHIFNSFSKGSHNPEPTLLIATLRAWSLRPTTPSLFIFFFPITQDVFHETDLSYLPLSTKIHRTGEFRQPHPLISPYISWIPSKHSPVPPWAPPHKDILSSRILQRQEWRTNHRV